MVLCMISAYKSRTFQFWNITFIVIDFCIGYEFRDFCIGYEFRELRNYIVKKKTTYRLFSHQGLKERNCVSLKVSQKQKEKDPSVYWGRSWHGPQSPGVSTWWREIQYALVLSLEGEDIKAQDWHITYEILIVLFSLLNTYWFRLPLHFNILYTSKELSIEIRNKKMTSIKNASFAHQCVGSYRSKKIEDHFQKLTQMVMIMNFMMPSRLSKESSSSS